MEAPVACALSTAVWLLSSISCSALEKPSTVCGRPCGVSYSGAAALRTRRPLHACSGHQGEIRQADSRVPSPAVPPPRGAEAKTIACATGSRNRSEEHTSELQSLRHLV